MDDSILFVGDTQETLLVEKLAGRESNPRERARLLGMLAEHTPRAVVLLGDIVSRPGVSRWAPIDVLLTQWRSRGVQIVAAVGNHDVMFESARGYRELRQRGLIPKETSWQTLTVSGLRIIVIDSNRGVVGRQRFAEQLAWAASEMEKADRDPAISLTVVVSHHPPYTNAKLVKGHEVLLTDAIAAMDRSTKAQLWVSGHCHAYERFQQGKRTYVVGGNAGAPRMGLLRDSRARHHDLAGAPNLSPFGWLHCAPTPGGAALEAKGFVDLGAPLLTFDRFSFGP